MHTGLRSSGHSLIACHRNIEVLELQRFFSAAVFGMRNLRAAQSFLELTLIRGFIFSSTAAKSLLSSGVINS